jgi:C4-dicarboxylate-specific signal transduction histidine kinase
MKKDNAAPESLRLRRQAEDRLRDKVPTMPPPSNREEIDRLHHELQVHQIELEIQNEELHRAKYEVEEVLERFVDLYDFAPVGYVTLDHKGTIRALNLTGATLLGEDRATLIGRPFRFFLVNAHSFFPEFLDRVFTGQGKESCEVTLLTLGKTPLTVRIEALVSNSSEECRVAIIDVTESRQKDFLLIAQNRLAAMGEMINNIAHQWRKPLNTLGLTIQQLLLSYDHGDLDRGTLEESIQKSMGLIRHMSQTIDDFKNYFKPDKEKVQFNVPEVIARALLLLEENCSSQEVRIQVISNDECCIYGYPNELLQVLINILINAIDALVEKAVIHPEITITIGREKERAVISIADNAGGISEEIIGQIFDPYFTTKKEGKGTGIGLYLSKTIIEKSMGGSLTAQNIRGGAQFRIEI